MSASLRLARSDLRLEQANPGEITIRHACGHEAAYSMAEGDLPGHARPELRCNLCVPWEEKLRRNDAILTRALREEHEAKLRFFASFRGCRREQP
jgi:hypothetical protein